MRNTDSAIFFLCFIKMSKILFYMENKQIWLHYFSDKKTIFFNGNEISKPDSASELNEVNNFSVLSILCFYVCFASIFYYIYNCFYCKIA